MDFRFLSAVDTPRLQTIPSDLFQGTLNASLLEKFLADPRNYFCAAFLDGVMVGYAAGVHLTRTNQGDEFYLREISVTSAWRDAGVSTSLLDHMLAKARELNCQAVWALAAENDADTNALYQQLGHVGAQNVMRYWFPSEGTAATTAPVIETSRKTAAAIRPHPSPVKSLNFLLQLQVAEKSGEPPGNKLAQQIASDFLPEDEMEVTLEIWRGVGWSWKFAIGQRHYEGILTVLADPRQALLQLGPLERFTFFGMQSKMSQEDLQPVREQTKLCLEKLPEVSDYQFSVDGFPDVQLAPDPTSLNRAIKKWEDEQATGVQRPVDKELNLFYRFLLSPIRSRRSLKTEPTRRIDVICVNILIGVAAFCRIYLSAYFPTDIHLLLAPACALLFGGGMAAYRRRLGWFVVSILTFSTLYFGMLLLHGLLRSI